MRPERLRVRSFVVSFRGQSSGTRAASGGKNVSGLNETEPEAFVDVFESAGA